MISHATQTRAHCRIRIPCTKALSNYTGWTSRSEPTLLCNWEFSLSVYMYKHRLSTGCVPSLLQHALSEQLPLVEVAKECWLSEAKDISTKQDYLLFICLLIWTT